MSFYYPLGLIGLIGVPILVLIYIIKSKYTEQTVASTYLWELSEKFLKKRKPISKLTGIITLILQILAVVIASLLVAQPVFTVRGSARDIYFVLDGSASMNTVEDGKTRFDRAKERIVDIIDDARSGSTYSLIFVGSSTDVLFDGVTDKAQAKASVNQLKSGWCTDDMPSALSVAQQYYDNNRSSIVYLVTDAKHKVGNLSLIDVSMGANNCAITDCVYRKTAGGVIGSGKVVSYSADVNLTVAMSVAETVGADYTRVATVKVECKKGEPADFELIADVAEFISVRLEITQADALNADNAVVLYDTAKAQERKVLFVNNTEDGTYLVNAIKTSGVAQVDVVSPKAYNESQLSGYGMYVFNGYTPLSLPKNAAIWLVNGIDGSGTGSGVGFREYTEPRDSTGPNSYYKCEYERGGSSQAFKLLTKNLVERNVVVRRYARYSMVGFETVLKVGGDPIIAAGLNENNDRQVVFAFELGDSNLGLIDDFLILVRNLMDYSFPAVIDSTLYDCGDIMNVNVVPGAESIVVTSPSGLSTTLDTLDNDICEVVLTEMGTYTVTAKISGADEDSVLYAYARVPEAESGVSDGETLVLRGEREYNYSDGYYDNLLVFFILIAVILLADWGVYCYEQHQLR
ncbi:MAG: BatA and WFA domain-containing protein [Clostridiales bacterium]|nr:BatA and WFA domain-containing protein [Clostridiales bacterium]